eukprot:1706465-Pyramimonas_sp.AAC.2
MKHEASARGSSGLRSPSCTLALYRFISASSISDVERLQPSKPRTVRRSTMEQKWSAWTLSSSPRASRRAAPVQLLTSLVDTVQNIMRGYCSAQLPIVYIHLSIHTL